MQRVNLIRIFQIVGACAVMVYCMVRLVQDAGLPQSDVVRRGGWRIGYLERWQEEVIYGIFIVMCGSLVLHTLQAARSAGRRSSEDKHDDI